MKHNNNESKIDFQVEEIASLTGQLDIKTKEAKAKAQKIVQMTKLLDDQKFATNEADKDNTELKLKIEIVRNTFGSLESEKRHLDLENGDKASLLEIYQQKNKELAAQLATTAQDL